jgi:hypothetical protein
MLVAVPAVPMWVVQLEVPADLCQAVAAVQEQALV